MKNTFINLKNENTVDYSKPLLEVIDLKKQYKKKKKPAIDKLNFKVYPGEFHAFVGANGAGKTTTIKSIIGSYNSFEGKILIKGISNRDVRAKQEIGYIPEIAKFPARLSSYNYLYHMALLNRLSKQEASSFVENILKYLNMWNLKDQCPNNFSSGQKKKILLAQSLSNNPSILIMDEPTANLDPKARINFFDILKELQKAGKSIFVSSHILSELDIYANAVTILDNGKIAYNGKREETKYKDFKYSFRFAIKKDYDKKLPYLKNFQIDEENQFIHGFNTMNESKKFINKLLDDNIFVKVEKYYLSIEDLYKKYVIHGSVDTKKE